MRYDILLSPGARDVIRKAPPNQQKALFIHLRNLSIAPVTLSMPGPTPPFVPGYQIYRFTVSDDGGRHEYVFQFKYMDNEKELWIAGIGHIPIDISGP